MDTVIQARGLTRHFGSKRVVDALDLDVPAGAIYALLGDNGSGKTTTIRMLTGLLPADAGRATILGLGCWRDAIALRHRVGYVPEKPRYYDWMTVGEIGRFTAGFHRAGFEPRYRALVERFQLEGGAKLKTLSKGGYAKVGLALALAIDPEVLILDEPTSGLDPLMEMAFRETVREAKERGQAVFLSSHILSEVEAICDRVGILREGRLVDQGTLADLRHLGAQTVEVTFDGHVPELPALPGVEVAEAGAKALRFEVSGSFGPLIAALADHVVVSLQSRAPSLEEIFLHHYEGEDRRGRG
jgi:polyether ionophore transport system ATP-binding protein